MSLLQLPIERSVGAAPAATRPRTRATSFPAIADYAFLSDREVNALIAPSGNVEWMCVPRPDAPSVFGALLDRRAGGFRFGPAGVSVPVARRYMPGSLVLETTWQTATGWLLVHDALGIGTWRSERRRSSYRRPPGDYEAEHCLIRTATCLDGTVALSLRCSPNFDYGRTDARWRYADDGYGTASATGTPDDPILTLGTDLRLGIEGCEVRAHHRLREGDTAFVALTWSDTGCLPRTFDQASERINRTVDHWREWLEQGRFPDHPWREHLQRSALTLKGLTYVPTGALLAAATTSLPETPQGERNWDYRFTWMRDATFALWGLYTLGFDHEADNFFAFVADASEGADDLQPMYGVAGETRLGERTLEHLQGYDGAVPVRVGNDAHLHRQHDVWGALIDSVHLHVEAKGHLPERLWPLLVRTVEGAIRNWRQPDRGIWEVRGEPRHFTSSKLMCWVACDRGARLALLHDDLELARRWRGVADEIRDDVCTHGVDERGVFVQHYGAKSLDASLLLMPLVRFLPADDPRIRATVMAIAHELAVDGLVLRYRVDDTDDGVSGAEGAFLMCSFWLVSALAEIGEVQRARQLCERLLSLASPLGLFAEEFDPSTGRHLGNFPQAFTHLSLINAAMRVIAVDRTQMR